MNGIDLLKRIKERDPNAPVVIITAFSEVDSAVEAIHEGALDYLAKPVDVDRLLRVVARAVKHFDLLRSMAPVAKADGSTDRIIGSSPEMQRLFKSIAQTAPTRATVLITGESGTGKELVAEAIHRGSPRASGPLVRLNCAALSESLLESELFGHERGSFTGADRRRRGRIEEANGGTLFLDEIGEIAPSLQVKLLRVLQERALERVGGNETIKVDVRFIAATNRDLRQLVAEGKFREDLFYRLDVVSLQLPALSERRSDIPSLATHFSNHLLFTRREDLEQPTQPHPSLLGRKGVDWRACGTIRNYVRQRALAALEERCIETHRLSRDRNRDVDLLQGQPCSLRKLGGGRVTTGLLAELLRNTTYLELGVEHVNRNANGSRVVRKRSVDGVANPPARVRAELESPPMIEPVDRAHQANAAF
ncbi:MAG TPA: sigma-54 dependent transcriptional regulator, partial [Polyangiaceae bacterium]|nr:sigma-54 dependent transcriptional regulator [Polyangiaceae bacterium]